LLVGLGATFLLAKGEVTAPAHWAMFHNWLQPAVQTNYNLIGADQHECWDGFNPGHLQDSPERNFDYLVVKARLGKWKNSRLYNEWIGNRNYRTYKKEGFVRLPSFLPGVPEELQENMCVAGTYHHKCNPVSGACTSEPTWCTTKKFPAPRITLRICPNVSDMNCVRGQARDTFWTDPIVQLVGTSMDQIMRRSGGNASGNPDFNDLFLLHGRVVDPRVNEPSCPSGFAYPQQPL